MSSKHSLSPQGTNFIISLEGIRRTLYNDNAGHCSIGIGHLIHYGNCVSLGPATRPQLPRDPQQRQYLQLEALYSQPLSQATALRLFASDVAGVEDVVNDRVAVPLNQPQFDALVSFTFNVGKIGFANSTLIKMLNAGRYRDVPREMQRWVRSTTNGVQTINPVLVQRRIREAALFQHGRY
jgi:lysozyme